MRHAWLGWNTGSERPLRVLMGINAMSVMTHSPRNMFQYQVRNALKPINKTK